MTSPSTARRQRPPRTASEKKRRWPRSWANSRLPVSPYLYTHRNARANLRLLGRPGTVLAAGRCAWTARRASRPSGCRRRAGRGGAAAAWLRTRTRCAPARRRPAFRARSQCRFVLPFIHFTPDSLTYSVPLFLKRQCDRIPPALPAAATPRRGRAVKV
jgi:hypothetical protein